MLFLRHFESENNALGGVLNHGDPALTPRGIADGRLSARHISERGIRLILCSPTRRAWHTAELVSDHYQYRLPIAVLHGLTEINWGNAAAGQPVDAVFAAPEVRQRAEDEGIYFRLAPDSETFAETHGRALQALEPYQDCGDEALVISHSTTIKTLNGVGRGLSRDDIRAIKIANGELVAFDPFAPQEPRRLFTPCQAAARTALAFELADAPVVEPIVVPDLVPQGMADLLAQVG